MELLLGSRESGCLTYTIETSRTISKVAVLFYIPTSNIIGPDFHHADEDYALRDGEATGWEKTWSLNTAMTATIFGHLPPFYSIRVR